MNEDFAKLPVDKTLTLGTADQRGYRHIFDIDQQTFDDLREEISRMITKEGCKLGQPLNNWQEQGTEEYKGLYEPLQKPPEENRVEK